MPGKPVRARACPGGHQVVDVLINRGYHPDSIVALAGRPLRIIFRRRDEDACFERVVFSSPHIDRRIPVAGSTTIELPSQPAGEVRFTCGMGRYSGRIQLVSGSSPSFLGRVRSQAMRIASWTGTALFRLARARSTETT